MREIHNVFLFTLRDNMRKKAVYHYHGNRAGPYNRRLPAAAVYRRRGH